MLLRIFGVVAVLALLASPVQAFHCPQDIKKIDTKMASDPDMGDDLRGKVTKLRDHGQELHDQGNHTKAVATLLKAKKLLKIAD